MQAAISVSSKQTCNQKTPIDKGKDQAAAPGMSQGWEEVSHLWESSGSLSRVRVMGQWSQGPPATPDTPQVSGQAGVSREAVAVPSLARVWNNLV